MDAHTLETKMAEACVLRPATRAITGVASADESAWAELRGPQCEDRTARDVVNPGCITKLVVGALARELLSEADIAGILGFDGDADSAAITLRHLIDHTHGFDTSDILACPRDSRGYIDIQSLRSQLFNAARLARPGELHSYSNASAWLTGAALEKYCGKDLATQVDAKLPELARRAAPVAPLCAATGEGMEFSPAALLSFLTSFWSGNERAPLLQGQNAATTVPLPGWSGAEQGVFWGWKTYASGWFGHNSAHAGAYGLVRVQPEQKLALFAFSNDLSCNSIAAALFGRIAPSLAPAGIPRLLALKESVPSTRYTGRYAVANMAVFIDQPDARNLTLRAHGLAKGMVSKSPFYEASLRAATDHFFYTEPRHPELFPYVQFVRPLNSGDSYLWNGKFLWRRQTEPMEWHP